MEIRGIDGMSGDDLEREIESGGRFVLYSYTVSLVVVTLRRSSAIRFVRGGESRLVGGLGCTLATALFGWWGFPWGPIYSLGSLVTNLGGGKDVTAEVLRALRGPTQPATGAAQRRAGLARRRDAG